MIEQDLITGSLVIYATLWYTESRTSMWNAEVIIPLALGAASGYMLYHFWLIRRVVRDTRPAAGRQVFPVMRPGRN